MLIHESNISLKLLIFVDLNPQGCYDFVGIDHDKVTKLKVRMYHVSQKLFMALKEFLILVGWRTNNKFNNDI